MKNFTLFFVFFLVAFLSVVTMAQTDFWEKINGPIAYGRRPLAINSDGTIFIGNNLGVFRSTDNGITWNNTGLHFSAYLFAFNFSNTMFTAGDSGLFRSTDDGLNWDLVNPSMTTELIASLAINESGHIFAGIWNGQCTGGVRRSTDGGVSWMNIGSFSNTYALAINTSGSIFAGGCTNSSAGVFSSTDNGTSWNNTYFNGSSNPVGELAFSPAGHIFVGISLWYGNSYNGDGIFRSTDSGVHWISSNFGKGTSSITSLAINANGHVFIGIYGDGVYRSTDDGETWATVNTGLTNDTVLAIGINPSGTIFAATNGGLFRSVQSTTSVKDLSADTPIRFSLNQNYPNPFNPSTIIRYAIPEASFTSIKVYDILGNEVATLVNEEKPAGRYEVSFSALQLSSGIYFYKLQAGSFVETKKMILIK